MKPFVIGIAGGTGSGKSTVARRLYESLHLDAAVEKISLSPIRPGTQPRFNPTFDEDLAKELGEAETASGAAIVCRQAEWPRVRAYIEAHGFRSIPLGDAYQGRVIFRIEANGRGRAPRPAPHPAPTPPA